MDKDFQKTLDDLSNKKLAKYSDAKLQAFENTSQMFKGKKFSDDHKKKIGESNKGKVVSKETLEKMSFATKGRKVSKEHREKIAKSNKGKNVGKKRSEETKKILSEIAKNRKYSNETRKKMSEKRKGKPFNKIASERGLEVKRKPILFYILPEMELLKEFPSLMDASKNLDIHRGNILRILNGKIKNPKKYFFKYK